MPQSRLVDLPKKYLKNTLHIFWKWSKNGSQNDVGHLVKLASKIDPWSGSSQMCVQTTKNTTLGTNFDRFFFQNASGCGRKTKHNCNSQNHVRGKLARAPSMRIPFFPKGSGRTRRTVHSEPRNYSQKLPRVPSMSATVFVHRPHSTPSMQIPFFPKGSGRTVHSEPRNYS